MPQQSALGLLGYGMCCQDRDSTCTCRHLNCTMYRVALCAMKSLRPMWAARRHVCLASAIICWDALLTTNSMLAQWRHTHVASSSHVLRALDATWAAHACSLFVSAIMIICGDALRAIRGANTRVHFVFDFMSWDALRAA